MSALPRLNRPLASKLQQPDRIQAEQARELAATQAARDELDRQLAEREQRVSAQGQAAESAHERVMPWMANSNALLSA